MKRNNKAGLIAILAIVAVVIFAGCVEEEAPISTPTLSPESTLSPTPTLALPMSGEWTASTGSSQFTFAFTVNPDSTGITEFSYSFKEFECMNVQISGGVVNIERDPMWPITGSQFTIDLVEMIEYGPDWDIGIEGRFDETGTHASGTWEISSAGTTCQASTWESSRAS